MIYLQLSTGQSPIECQFFAHHIWRKMLKEAKQIHLSTEIISETLSPKNIGLLSGIMRVSGDLAHEQDFIQHWVGSLQWICKSPFRPNHARKNWFISVSQLPQIPDFKDIQDFQDNSKIKFESCRASGKGGQHVNTTDSAVRATHLATGISVRVESERSQHANKKLARELLAIKLNEYLSQQNQLYAQNQHAQLYQLERGNAIRIFKGMDFQE